MSPRTSIALFPLTAGQAPSIESVRVDDSSECRGPLGGGWRPVAVALTIPLGSYEDVDVLDMDSSIAT